MRELQKIGNSSRGPETPGDFQGAVGPLLVAGFLEGEPDFVLLVGCSESEGFEGVFVIDFKLLGESDEYILRLVGGKVAHGEGDISTNSGVGVVGELGGVGQDILSGTAEGAVGRDADLRVLFVVQEHLASSPAGFAKVRKNPDRAGSDKPIGVGFAKHFLQGGNGFFSVFFECHKPEIAGVDGG